MCQIHCLRGGLRGIDILNELEYVSNTLFKRGFERN